MADKSSKELINTLRFDDNIRSNVNSFDYRKHLFDFGIDSDLSLNEDKQIPRLKEEFNQNKTGMHFNLEDGLRRALDNKKLITNYDNNRKQTWTHFLQMVHKKNIIEEEEPTFVTLTALFCSLFTCKEWDQTFFAIKFKGVIYLFDHKNTELEEAKRMVTSKALFRKPNFFIIRFLYLITDKNDSDINGFEMNMRVDSICLNGNKLIVCHAIAANDRNGSPVYVKCRQFYPQYEYKQSLLYDWSHCMVSGVQKHLLGTKSRSDVLTKIEVMDVNAIACRKACLKHWSPQKVFSFVDQALEFMKSCVGSELELYEFKINSKPKTIDCFRHNSNYNSDNFLPEFYTQ